MFSGQQKLSRVFSITVFSDSSTPKMLSFLFQLKHSRNGSSVVIYIVKYACKRKNAENGMTYSLQMGEEYLGWLEA